MPAPEDRVLTVLELTRAIKETLADSFGSVWVKGEISNFKRAESGHLYFNLKEGREALLACVMWRGSAMRLGFQPADGTEVEAFGEITVYEPRGNYQLVVKALRPGGLGALLLQLEELKRRLQAEGLFDAARKRALPRFPRTVGVVTSPVGAAVRDVIKVLRARWPSVRIVLAPVRVQGEGAAAEIAAAIGRFGRWGGADVLIVGRGGGSLEDLWAFNEEPVVRAIAASPVPVISAVGHEVDWTLADLVADVRAATPSNAAELAVRDRAEMAHRVEQWAERADRAVRAAVAERRRALERLLGRYGFRTVREVFGDWQQRVDELRGRMDAALRSRVASLRQRLDAARSAYGLREFPRVLVERRHQAAQLAGRLEDAVVDHVQSQRRRVTALDDRLRALSPRAVLQRGYALVRGEDGAFVRTATALVEGQRVTLEFARGEAGAIIHTIRPGDPDATQEERGGPDRR
jgi:exodeoxyribonuclease VII large subunit